MRPRRRRWWGREARHDHCGSIIRLPDCSTILVQYRCVRLMLMISSKEYWQCGKSYMRFGFGR